MMKYQEIARYAVPGSPDWFLCGVLSCTSWNYTENGGHAVIAFSSKSYVHIFTLDIVEETNRYCSCSWSYIGQVNAHHERISAVTFHETSYLTVITCGLDGLVRQWKYADEDWGLFLELNVHSIREKVDPTALSACYNVEKASSFTLVGTNKGLLIVWCSNQDKNKSNYVSKKYENDAVLTCSWESKVVFSGAFKVAVGYKKGIVGVYTFKPAEITSTSDFFQVSRICAHEKDVCHVVWRPCFGNEDSSSELITTGRDQLVKVWNICSSECLASVKVPGRLRNQGSSTESGNRMNQKDNVIGAPWISASYITSDQQTWEILFSGLHGEIYKLGPNSSLINLKPENQGHSMIIFSMVYIANSPGLLLSVSQDRMLIVWKLMKEDNLSIVTRLPTLSSGVLSLTQSMYGNSPVIAGLSDGSLFFLRTNCLSRLADENIKSNSNQFITFSPRGQQSSPISALAWHPLPQYENLIVYGNEAGYVEILDINKLQRIQNKSKSQPHSFGSMVYRVAWGPVLFGDISHKKIRKKDYVGHTKNFNESSNELEKIHDLNETEESHTDKSVDKKSEKVPKFPFYVYSVCKGKIYCHLGNSRPPVDVSNKFPHPPEITDEEWQTLVRSDISFLSLDSQSDTKVDVCESQTITENYNCLVAVGYRSGVVDIYGLLNEKKQDYAFHNDKLLLLCRIVNHFKGINCLAWSPTHLWLAIGSNENYITVTDLRGQLTEITKQADQTKFVQLSNCYLARLEGHYNRITCLDWSPHDPYLLLSCSYDGTSNVWRVHPEISEESAVSVANFRAHRLRLFACLWSRHEPDLAFTGGELCHLFGWKPSQQLHKQPPHVRRYRPPLIKKIKDKEIIAEVTDNGDGDNPSNLKSFENEESDVVQTNITVEQYCTSEVLSEKVDNDNVAENLTTLSTSQTHKLIPTQKVERRKRPALLPSFLLFNDYKNCAFDLDQSPPIRLCSVLTQILNVSDLISHNIELPEPMNDLLVLLPETPQTRSHILKILKNEADNHVKTYFLSQGPNSLAHLEAYFILHIWLGQISAVCSLMVSESHLPFWLLWAVELTQSNASSLIPSESDSSNFGIDLLGEKIKEMQLQNHDILITSTLLICAHRIYEAIELLISYGRIKEALILIRLRLNPTESRNYIYKCLEKLNEHNNNNNKLLMNEKLFYTIIYHIGLKEWSKAINLFHHQVERINLCLNSECEQLSWNWIDISLFLLDKGNNNISLNYLNLSSLCLSVGFKLFPIEPLFFQHWFDAFQRILNNSYTTSTCESSSRIALICSLILLDTGRLVNIYFQNLESSSIILSSNSNLNLNLYNELINSNCIYFLNQLKSTRQPSTKWEICLRNFSIDFVIYYLIRQIDSNQLEENLFSQLTDQFLWSRKNCEQLKSTEIITNLFAFLWSTYFQTFHSNYLVESFNELNLDTNNNHNGQNNEIIEQSDNIHHNNLNLSLNCTDSSN